MGLLRKRRAGVGTPDAKVNRLWYHLWYVLNSNRAHKGAAVQADFNVPTKFGYWGCYLWDTAFHVIGQTYLKDKTISKDSVRALLSMQFPNGFLPVNSGADDAEVVTTEGTYYLSRSDFYSYREQAIHICPNWNSGIRTLTSGACRK